MASHRPQSVELVDFCVRDESFTLFISGIPKLHVGELQGRIVLLAGQPLHSYVFDWNAGPASMRVTTMTLTGARNVVEALDGALFRGRRLRVQHKLAKHANAGWARPTHRLPLLTARQVRRLRGAMAQRHTPAHATCPLYSAAWWRRGCWAAAAGVTASSSSHLSWRVN